MRISAAPSGAGTQDSCRRSTSNPWQHESPTVCPALLTTSNIEPLPHQLRAVYGELLPRTPLRFLLADDPGAGKTVTDVIPTDVSLRLLEIGLQAIKPSPYCMLTAPIIDDQKTRSRSGDQPDRTLPTLNVEEPR